MNQMFEISEKLLTEQSDEIYGFWIQLTNGETISCVLFMSSTLESSENGKELFRGIPSRTQKISHSNKCSTYLQDWCLNKMRSQDWKQLVGKNIHGDERIINLQRTKVYVFSDHVLCCAVGSFSKILNLTMHGSKDQDGSNLQKITETVTEWMVHEWNIFPGFSMWQLSEVKSLLYRLGETPEIFTGTISILSIVQRHFLWSMKETMYLCTRFGKGQWSFIGPGSGKKWNCTSEDRSTRNLRLYRGKDVVWIRRKHRSNFPCYDPIVQRSTQKQSSWKIVDTLCCHSGNNWGYFSHN